MSSVRTADGASSSVLVLQLKADSLGMDNIVYDFPVAGSHSWGYWQGELSQSWPMLSEPLYATDQISSAAA